MIVNVVINMHFLLPINELVIIKTRVMGFWANTARAPARSAYGKLKPSAMGLSRTRSPYSIVRIFPFQSPQCLHISLIELPQLGVNKHQPTGPTCLTHGQVNHWQFSSASVMPLMGLIPTQSPKFVAPLKGLIPT